MFAYLTNLIITCIVPFLNFPYCALLDFANKEKWTVYPCLLTCFKIYIYSYLSSVCCDLTSWLYNTSAGVFCRGFESQLTSEQGPSVGGLSPS